MFTFSSYGLMNGGVPTYEDLLTRSDRFASIIYFAFTGYIKACIRCISISSCTQEILLQEPAGISLACCQHLQNVGQFSQYASALFPKR